jgi:hypothetical protein
VQFAMKKATKTASDAVKEGTESGSIAEAEK